jgi:hypothetical protein
VPTACFFLLVLLVTATAALGTDSKHAGNSAIATLIMAPGVASVVGLLARGFGLSPRYRQTITTPKKIPHNAGALQVSNRPEMIVAGYVLVT